VLVEAGTHPDYQFAGLAEDALEVSIDTVRDLCRGLALKPARGGYKIAILDDADALNDAAANCFLKTLEEPPPHSVLILIGTSAERQLPTIVSRCQVIRFQPLPPTLITELLEREGSADPALVARLARMSGGSLGQARALTEPALWSFREELLKELTRQPVDTVAVGQKWIRFLEEAGKEASVQRKRASLVLQLLIEFFSDALRLQAGGPALLDSPRDMELLSRIVETARPEQLAEIIERCLECDFHIERRVQLVLAVESLVDALGQRLGQTTSADARGTVVTAVGQEAVGRSR
jgi:DNA polymerase-3 subunit delta'